MYMRWRVPLPGMLALTPIVSGALAVSQTLTVAQRCLAAVAGVGTKTSSASPSSGPLARDSGLKRIGLIMAKNTTRAHSCCDGSRART